MGLCVYLRRGYYKGTIGDIVGGVHIVIVQSSCDVQYCLEVLTPQASGINFIFAAGDRPALPSVKKIFPLRKQRLGLLRKIYHGRKDEACKNSG